MKCHNIQSFKHLVIFSNLFKWSSSVTFIPRRQRLPFAITKQLASCYLTDTMPLFHFFYTPTPLLCWHIETDFIFCINSCRSNGSPARRCHFNTLPRNICCYYQLLRSFGVKLENRKRVTIVIACNLLWLLMAAVGCCRRFCCCLCYCCCCDSCLQTAGCIHY